MIETLDGYDWQEAFGYADTPTSVPPGQRVRDAGFSREDVAEIVWIQEGENDGPDWLIGGTLNDGRWFFLAAGCDYTGWDCQAGGNAYVALGRADIERYAMGDSDRDRLGIVLEGERRMESASW